MYHEQAVERRDDSSLPVNQCGALDPCGPLCFVIYIECWMESLPAKHSLPQPVGYRSRVGPPDVGVGIQQQLTPQYGRDGSDNDNETDRTHTDNHGYSRSHSSIHMAADASLGMCQPHRGDRLTGVACGPSGIHERLNCCVKNLRQNTVSQCFISSSEYRDPNTPTASWWM